MLQRLGCEVALATNGQNALDLFSSDPDTFDIIITDQEMPEMTGSDLAKHALAIRPDIPLLLVTGNKDELDKKDIKLRGIREVLGKPLEVDSLAGAINRVVQKQ